MEDKFAPLSADEIDKAATIALTDNDDAGEIVLPVPAGAPPAPAVHPRFGNAVTIWKYRDAQGALLFEVHRFEPAGEGKQYLPLSLWRDNGGKLQWRWKGVPAPRPLYGLDRLTANPAASVIVTEGEKASEAAARIFPKSVATTSPGGAKAANKADWKPLAGRRVLVWPDADTPGAKYARQVAETLAALGCQVSVLDAMALAAMAPDGSRREPVARWDAADAVDEFPDLTALRKAAHALAKPFDLGPAYLSWGAFKMGADGLVVEVTKGRGDSKETFTEWVSAPFEILGASRDPNGKDWGKWLRWRDGDGREHRRHVTEAALQGEPAALAASLASDGLRVDRAHQRALANYLCGVSTKGRVTVVARTGWHTIVGRDVFVLPDETIGPRGAETVILNAAAVGPYETRGSLDHWQSGVGALVADHALAVLAVSAALAGPLLHLAGQEGGGLNFFGQSSKGKTTILQAAASVWGRGASPGYVRAWRATANGLEGAAASATDTSLVLDELGVVEARDAAAAVYGLANGSGKARSARDGSLREPKSWRVLLLSTGEFPLETKLAEDRGRRARAGQMVRLLDIPADRGLGFGAFDHAGPDGDAGALAKAIKLATSIAYGTAGPEFIRRLIAERIGGDAVGAMVADFIAEALPSGADGQISRAAQRLGLIAVAGELAIELGVAPWRKGGPSAAAAWALGQWIDGRGGTEPAEIRQAIEAVRLIIQLHGESRFEALGGEDARPVLNRLGWRKGEGSGREWWIPPEVWKAEICNGLDPRFVARALTERGLLRVQGGAGFQCKVNLGGDRRANAYVLTAAVLEGDANAP